MRIALKIYIKYLLGAKNIMQSQKKPQKISSIGFRYFQDTEHYRAADLKKWVPILKELGCQWLVLFSESSRSIPEPFLKGIHENGIQTIVEIQAHISDIKSEQNIELLLHQYGVWGVKAVQLSGNPNMKTYWGNDWVRKNIIEEFYNGFLYFSELALSKGLSPMMPILVPGGDFWDTAFLHYLFERFIDDKHKDVVRKVILSAGGWSYDHPLTWGAGGHEIWTETRPYLTPKGSEDQIGFHTYEWYLEIAREVLGKNLPVFLFGLGEESSFTQEANTEEVNSFDERVLEICNYLTDKSSPFPYREWIIAGEFSRLDTLSEEKTGFYTNGKPNTSLISVFQEKMGERLLQTEKANGLNSEKNINRDIFVDKTIEQYLLLPVYEWGVSDWHLEIIKPYVRKHKTTVGFSPDEAKYAKSVVIVGDTGVISSDIEIMLKDYQCEVIRIAGDDKEIASQLSVR